MKGECVNISNLITLIIVNKFDNYKKKKINITLYLGINI